MWGNVASNSRATVGGAGLWPRIRCPDHHWCRCVWATSEPKGRLGRDGYPAYAQAKPDRRVPRSGHQLTCPITSSPFCLALTWRHSFIRSALFQELFLAAVSAYCWWSFFFFPSSTDSLKIWIFKSHESEKNEKKNKTASQAQQVIPHWHYLELFLTFNLVLLVGLFVCTNTGEMKGIFTFHLRRTYFWCSTPVWEDVHDLTGGKAIPNAPSCACITENRGHYLAQARTVTVFFFPFLSK